jgi:hypothetical protein
VQRAGYLNLECIQIFFGNGSWLLRITQLFESDINMDLKEIGCEEGKYGD